MRRTISSGSAKAFWLDRDGIIERLKAVSARAGAVFPEIKEIRLFGSLAKGEHTGFSDVDIFVLTGSAEKNPIERMKPYYLFFAERFDLAIDMLAAVPEESEAFSDMLRGSIRLYPEESAGTEGR